MRIRSAGPFRAPKNWHFQTARKNHATRVIQRFLKDVVQKKGVAYGMRSFKRIVQDFKQVEGLEHRREFLQSGDTIKALYFAGRAVGILAHSSHKFEVGPAVLALSEAFRMHSAPEIYFPSCSLGYPEIKLLESADHLMNAATIPALVSKQSFFCELMTTPVSSFCFFLAKYKVFELARRRMGLEIH